MLSWLKPCWQLRLCRSSFPLASSTLEEGPLDPGSRVKGQYQGFYRCQTKGQDDHLKKGKDGRRRRVDAGVGRNRGVRASRGRLAVVARAQSLEKEKRYLMIVIEEY